VQPGARCCAILRLLLRSNAPLPAAEIASRLGVTPRMVRYCLPEGRRWLRTQGLDLQAVAGSGMLVTAPDDVRTRSLCHLNRLGPMLLPPKPADRVRLLLLTLFAASEPMVLKQLERLLAVSRMTVLRDLRKAEQWLAAQGLQLLRKPNYGFKLCGDEYQLRRAIVDLVVESADEATLLSLCGSDPPEADPSSRATTAVGHALGAFLKEIGVRNGSRLLSSLRARADLRIADDSHVSLALYLSVALWRFRRDQRVRDCPGGIRDLKGRHEYALAAAAAESVQRRFGLILPEAEVACIAMALLAAEVTWKAEAETAPEAADERMTGQAAGIAGHILAAASTYLHPSLRVDPELAHSLQTHVRAVLDRMRFDVAIGKSVSQDVQSRYPYIYGVAKQSTAVFEQVAGKTLPDEEVGYIAMYLAAAMERLRPAGGIKARILVICNAGVASAWMLVSRLRSELPTAEVVAVMSALELQGRVSAREVDLIVSTVPLPPCAVPVVVVSPFLDPQDAARVRQAVSTPLPAGAPAAAIAAPPPPALSLADLLTEQTVRLKVRASGWQQVVSSAGKLLVDAGFAEARYIEAMLAPIRRHGPYMVMWPGIALLHGMPQAGVKQVCMALITLACPVAFGHARNDPVDVAVALGAMDGRSHLTALSQLVRLFDDPDAVSILRSAKDMQQIIGLLHGQPSLRGKQV